MSGTVVPYCRTIDYRVVLNYITVRYHMSL